jgi:hypothetical protein
MRLTIMQDGKHDTKVFIDGVEQPDITKIVVKISVASTEVTVTRVSDDIIMDVDVDKISNKHIDE